MVRRLYFASPLIKICFNSRTREGATANRVKTSTKKSFNSRTREGATIPVPPYHKPFSVSIHAPVRVRPGELDLVNWDVEFQFTHP